MSRPTPSALAFDLATIRVLAGRDLTRFFRQRSRVFGAIAQPLLFWAVLGSGFDASFRQPGAEGVPYARYFFPGVVLMVVLFNSIFSTMSLIEDRAQGFMQAVLAAPGSRLSVVLGKVLGGTLLSLIQASLVVALAPLAGIPLRSIAWPMLFAMLALTSLALTALGFAIAWWLDSVQGYHAVMSVVLLPAWIVSGAVFPVAGGPGWMRVVMRGNPLTYAADGVRRALGGTVTNGGASAGVELACVAVLAAIALTLAVRICQRRTGK